MMTMSRGVRARDRRDVSCQGGFTLVELLVVVVILGILSVVVVFAVRGSGDKGRPAAVATDERIIRTALEVYCAQNDKYPAADTSATPPKDAMDALVDAKLLSSRSTYHQLSTGTDPNEPRTVYPEGNCPGVGPRHYKLVAVDPVAPSLVGFAATSAGERHLLYLRSDGTVWAAGFNSSGQLGVGNTGDVGLTPSGFTPVQVLAPEGVDGFLGDVKAIAAGSNFSVALKNDGTVWAWGVNYDGQLGDGTVTGRSRPVQVHAPEGGGFLGGVKAIAVSSRGFHTTALKEDGTVVAWGSNKAPEGSDGQLGDGTTVNRSTPVQVVAPAGSSGFLGGVKAIAASVAVKNDGTVLSWGSNGSTRPMQVILTTPPFNGTPLNGAPLTGPPFDGVTAVSAGETATVALKGDGTVWSWESNGFAKPVQVKFENGDPFNGVTAVSAGVEHVLASTTGGKLWAWGANVFGVLGDGTAVNRSTPVRVLGVDGVGTLDDVTAFSAGADFSMALKGNVLLGWGYNGAYQVDFGPTSWVPAGAFRPSNDDFANAREVPTSGGNGVGRNWLATKEPNEPDHVPPPVQSGGFSVWYRWTAPRNGRVTISTENDLNLLTMGVYTGTSVNNLTVVGRGGEPGTSQGYSHSNLTELTVDVTAGTVYHIAVDSKPSTNGFPTINTGGFNFSLTFSLVP